MLPPFSQWLKLPPIPVYRDEVHPLVVHFPIALLLVAPLLVFLAIVLARRGRWFAVSALLLLALGTGGAYWAVCSGQAARDVAENLSDDALDALDKHAELAQAVPIVFAILTGVYAAIIILPLLIRPLGHPIVIFLLDLVFLVVLVVADLLVVHAAHSGGRVVHQFGVRAQMSMPAEEGQPAQKPQVEKPKEDTKPAAEASAKK